MITVFISYRRNDSLALTGRIFDRLSAAFGNKAIFMDIDTIPPGVDFRKHLQKAVTRCKVVVAIVGQKWLGTLLSLSRGLNQIWGRTTLSDLLSNVYLSETAIFGP